MKIAKKLILLVALVGLMLVLTGCATTVLSYEDDISYLPAEKFQAEVKEEITALNVQWYKGEVNVKFYDGDTVLIKESGDDAAEHPFTYLARDGELIVQYSAAGVRTHLKGKVLNVSIPKSYSLELVEVKTTDADINVSDIKTTSVILSSDVGAISVKSSLVTRTLSCTTSVGLISVGEGTQVRRSLECANVIGAISATLDGTVDIVKANNRIGATEISCSIKEELKAESMIGAMKLTTEKLPESINVYALASALEIVLPEGDFAFRASSETGSVNCQHEYKKSARVDEDGVYGAKGERYVVSVVGEGSENEYLLESTFGDITVKKLSKAEEE